MYPFHMRTKPGRTRLVGPCERGNGGGGGGGGLIRGVKNVSSFDLLWAIAVVSKLERYLNTCYRSIS